MRSKIPTTCNKGGSEVTGFAMSDIQTFFRHCGRVLTNPARRLTLRQPTGKDISCEEALFAAGFASTEETELGALDFISGYACSLRAHSLHTIR